jgi:hypothetical protein
MKSTFIFLPFLMLLFALQACDNRASGSHEWGAKDLVLKLEAPVTPGPNSLQAEIPLKLDEFAKSHNMDLASIEKVAMISATIRLEDGNQNFDNFESFNFQFVGENTNMKEAGICSKIEKGSKTLKAELVKDHNLRPLFKNNAITLVLDANAINEDSLNYNFKVDLQFQITAKLNAK